jgi:alkanesulfonate monooxygenase SsuD/methylene tetrahydromethanopterin reductase-like flavin-dependent oxidoreductase (luciferase family)
MKFIAITRITHLPDPITGRVTSATDRLRETVDGAVQAEELGFDGFGVEERHERPFVSSSAPVVLSHIAARTSVIRLFAAITAVSLLDPVRAFEDYSMLDHLCGGRLELIIGEDAVTRTGRFRPPRQDAETWPRPLQQPIRIWQGGATSTDSADLAARWGDPLFSTSVTSPVESSAALVRCYRERWEFYGWDPAAILIGAGTAGYYSARTSQQAIETYRPIYNARQVRLRALGLKPAFCSLEDAIERGSILIGSPQQITDQVLRYHERLGHEVMHLPSDADGLTGAQHRESLELFFDKIAPVLRREIPSRPFPQAPVTPGSAPFVPALSVPASFVPALQDGLGE